MSKFGANVFLTRTTSNYFRRVDIIVNRFVTYSISSYSFRGNYSFLNLEFQRSQYINVRKLFKGGNYMRKYGIV